jgi:hypothetical protein
MINVHSQQEGNAFRLEFGSETEDMMWVLLEHRSKNLAAARQVMVA